VLSITGYFFKGQSARYIQDQMAEFIGENAASVIASTITSVNQAEHGFAATLIGIFVLFVGASGVFVQLQDSMNRIWGVTAKPGHFVRDLLKQRLASFAMIFGVSFLLLVSLLVSAALAAITGYFNYLLPSGEFIWNALNVILSFGIVTLVFAATYKLVPDVHIDWKDVWVGALVTAVLFTAGKSLIGFYLGRTAIGSAFGAAGSILVVLAWVYYTSQTLFFGAEFTKVYCEEHRSTIQRVAGAEAVTKDAQAREHGEIRGSNRL
jgi:membrane protein